MIDFGLTASVAQLVYGCIGTKEYMPVEVRASGNSPYPQLHTYDPSKVDVFTCGIMLFLLAFGQMPFCKATKDDQYYRHLFNNDVKSFLLEHPATKDLYLQN